MAKPGANAGDGKTNPFGDGKGGAGESKPSKGNDFVKNPWGNPSATGKPRVLGPAEAGSPSQKASDGADTNAESVPQGGKLPFPAADPGEDKGNPIGGRPQGQGRKPMKLNG